MTTRWYRISNYWPARIQPVEVEAETDGFITVLESLDLYRFKRHRYAKVCGTQQFFRTFVEAKAALIDREGRRVEALRQELDAAERAVKALAEMTEEEAQ